VAKLLRKSEMAKGMCKKYCRAAKNAAKTIQATNKKSFFTVPLPLI
jgi:hypothetical protein